jgi:DNA replication protein DnaC
VIPQTRTTSENSEKKSEPSIPKFRHEWFEDLGIPARYSRCTLDQIIRNDKNAELVDAVKQIAEALFRGDPQPKGIFAYGTPGNGKTHMQCCIAKAALLHEFELMCKRDQYHRGTPVFSGISICKFRDILVRVTERWKQPERADPVEELSESRLIFIDDMTVRVDEKRNPQSVYQWASDAMNNLIDKIWDRGEGECLLFITSNNSRVEIAKAFGDPFFDRIAGLCHCIENTDESHR